MRPNRFQYKCLFVPGHSGDAGLDTILFGEITDLQSEVIFFITFSTSVFSASLGLAKCLKVGVAKCISSSGPLDGLLNGKFLIAIVASALALISKGVIIGFIVINHPLVILLIMAVLFLPQLFLATLTTIDFRDINSIKILIQHPSLILLPVFTYFSFARINSCLCGASNDIRVEFNYFFTWTNIVFNVVEHCIVYWILLYQSLDLVVLIVVSAPILVAGIIFTVTFLYMDKLCWCCPSAHTQSVRTVYDPNEHLEEKQSYNLKVCL